MKDHILEILCHSLYCNYYFYFFNVFYILNFRRFGI